MYQSAKLLVQISLSLEIIVEQLTKIIIVEIIIMIPLVIQKAVNDSCACGLFSDVVKCTLIG